MAQADLEIPLVSTSGDHLRLIETVVKHRLIAHSGPGKITGREYEDAMNYMTVDLDVRSDRSLELRIEFGVRDGRQFRPTGGFVAAWQAESDAIGAIDVVLLDGERSDLSSFARRFSTYLNLPEVAADGVLNEQRVSQVV